MYIYHKSLEKTTKNSKFIFFQQKLDRITSIIYNNVITQRRKLMIVWIDELMLGLGCLILGFIIGFFIKSYQVKKQLKTKNDNNK